MKKTANANQAPTAIRKAEADAAKRQAILEEKKRKEQEANSAATAVNQSELEDVSDKTENKDQDKNSKVVTDENNVIKVCIGIISCDICREIVYVIIFRKRCNQSDNYAHPKAAKTPTLIIPF